MGGSRCRGLEARLCVCPMLSDEANWAETCGLYPEGDEVPFLLILPKS